MPGDAAVSCFFVSVEFVPGSIMDRYCYIISFSRQAAPRNCLPEHKKARQAHPPGRYFVSLPVDKLIVALLTISVAASYKNDYP